MKEEQETSTLTAPEVQPNSLAIVAPTPLDLLQQAIKQGVSIEQLERLQAMYERWEANEAKKAFVSAMNEFKKNPPTILKNKQVAFKDVRYSYAALDQVCDAVTAALSVVGISHRWKVDQKDTVISVTCVLTHELGHSEETTLLGNPDNTGSKNSIQAIGSTVSYLQRYTLLSATGLAATADDDGHKAEQQEQTGMSEDRFDECIQWIAQCRTMEDLEKVYRAVYSEAKGLKDQSAMKSFVAAKDARKKELQ